MRQTTEAKNQPETRVMTAATLACYMVALVCVFAFSYSLAALAAPSLNNARAAFKSEARP